MIKDTKDISLRFKEVLLNGKWVANTNYKELLTDLDWVIATKKVKNLNTIALLTQHINYYIFGVLQVFNGGTLTIRDKFSFNFPEIQSKKEWDILLNDLFNNSEKFANHVAKMSEHQLNQNFVAEKYGSYKRNIEAMIEHSYYHLGQISLLKKILEDT